MEINYEKVFQKTKQGFDIQNWIADTFYLGGQGHILWFPK